METGPCRDKWNLAAPEGEILFSSCDDERSRRAVNRDSARRRAATLGRLPTGKPGGSKAHRRNASFLDAPATHPFSDLLCCSSRSSTSTLRWVSGLEFSFLNPSLPPQLFLLKVRSQRYRVPLPAFGINSGFRENLRVRRTGSPGAKTKRQIW
jgi:hypothetical protein